MSLRISGKIGLRSSTSLNFRNIALLTPDKLFAAGEQGVWYDPSDMTTMFQDAAGTTPVTAVEQPVGLILDKSKGLAVQSTDALAGKGNFSDAAYWGSVNGVATISGGKLSFNGSATAGGVWSNSSTHLVIGKFYEITFTVDSISQGGIRIFLGTGTPLYTATTAGVHTFRAACVGDREVRIYNNSTATTAVVDNVLIYEIAGNHASQSTSAARPVLSARVNLLTRTEDFSHADWSNQGSSVTTNAETAPNGTQTADFIYETATTGDHNRFYTLDATSGVTYRFSVALKKGFSDWVSIYLLNATTSKGVRFWYNLSTGGKGTTANIGTGLSGVDYYVEPDANGFYRCYAVATADANSTNFRAYIGLARSDGGAASYAGDTTYGVYAWGADLRVSNDGVGLPAYQRVNTSTDYDTVGFPMYLKFDGVDDNLDMPLNISTLNLNIWAGARETGNVIVNSRVMFIGDSTGSINNLGLTINGGALASSSVGYRFPENEPVNLGMTTNDTVVVSYQRSSTTLQSARRNGANLTNNTATTTTFTSTTGRVGCGFSSSTNNTFLNGRLYSLIVRGAASTPVEIDATEKWVNSKTRAY